MKDVKYKQCVIQYENEGLYHMAWIPTTFAKQNKKIVIGKNKKSGKRAIVVTVYNTVALTEKQISINKENPLRKVTDI